MAKNNPNLGSNSPAGINLESLLDAMLDAMVVIDRHGIIEQVNRAALHLFGYEAGEICGKNISTLMGGADKTGHDAYLDRYKKTKKKRIIDIGREVSATHKDGSTFPVHIEVGEVGSAANVRYIGLIRDLREQRRAEDAALKQREEMVNVSRLSMMGEMAAAMAHELNQPLTAIANFAAASNRLLENDPVGNIDIVREALQDIQDQAHRAGEVIQRTRNFTHSGDTEKHDTTLAEVYHQVASLAQLDSNANNIRMTVNIPADLPRIEVDPVQIQQVMLNLIRNAVDAMSDTAPAEREIEIGAKMTGPHELRFEVQDHGCGISKNDSTSIFNAFFTTKASGMGMGLAICRTIMRKHGGELRYRHNDGQNPTAGMTFFFTLPTKVKA